MNDFEMLLLLLSSLQALGFFYEIRYRDWGNVAYTYADNTHTLRAPGHGILKRSRFSPNLNV